MKAKVLKKKEGKNKYSPSNYCPLHLIHVTSIRQSITVDSVLDWNPGHLSSVSSPAICYWCDFGKAISLEHCT